MNPTPPLGIVNPNPYLLWVDGNQLGTFGFHGKDVAPHFDFRLPAEVGDITPNIELQDLEDGATHNLSDFRGQYVLLDFWATWCGPCQSALEKLDREVADHAQQWKDRLVILPISIDDDPQTARPHFANRGWTHLHTYWSGEGEKVGWNAPALKAFVFSAVPSSVLVDREGKIIWLGNPANEEHAEQLQSAIENAIQK